MIGNRMDSCSSCACRSVINLTDNVFLYSYKYDEPMSIVYEIECARFRALKFSLSLKGTVNMVVEDTRGTYVERTQLLQSDIGPFERIRLCRLVCADTTLRSVLNTSYSWEIRSLNIPQTMKAVSIEDEMKGEIQAFRELFATRRGTLDCRFEDICETNECSFVDLSFIPSSSSLGDIDLPRGTVAAWRRSSDISPSLCMFERHIQPWDIRPGCFGNMGFLCAVAAMAEYPALIQKLFCAEYQDINPYGVYALSLCPAGELTTIHVDDFLPCLLQGGGSFSGPICSRSHGQDLWLMILEKAFAKVCGGYGLLRGVSVAMTLRSLSGAPLKSLQCPSGALSGGRQEQTFWSRLVKYVSASYVVVAHCTGRNPEEPICSVSRDSRGLVRNYPYTVLDARRTSLGDQLVQLRSPLNVTKFEWTGDWSDSSPKWTVEMQSELDVDCDFEDHTFWMSFADFCESFSHLDVCMVKHELRSGSEDALWHTCRHRIFLTPEENEETLRPNAMSVLKVTGAATEVFLSMQYSHCLQKPGEVVADIGIAVLRVTPDYCFDGVYLVVALVNSRGSDKDTAVGEGTSPPASLVDSSGMFSQKTREVLDEIFTRLDGDMDGVLYRSELDMYLHTTEGSASGGVTDEIYDWLTSNFDAESGGLTCTGFRQVCMYMYETGGRDPDILLSDMRYMGYDDSLKLKGGQNLIITAQSESRAISLHPQCFDKSAFAEAFEAVQGKVEQSKAGQDSFRFS